MRKQKTDDTERLPSVSVARLPSVSIEMVHADEFPENLPVCHQAGHQTSSIDTNFKRTFNSQEGVLSMISGSRMRTFSSAFTKIVMFEGHAREDCSTVHISDLGSFLAFGALTVPLAVLFISFLGGCVLCISEGWTLFNAVAYVLTNLSGVMDDLCKEECPVPQRIISEIVTVLVVIWGVAFASFFIGLAGNFHVVKYAAHVWQDYFGNYKMAVFILFLIPAIFFTFCAINSIFVCVIDSAPYWSVCTYVMSEICGLNDPIGEYEAQSLTVKWILAWISCFDMTILGAILGILLEWNYDHPMFSFLHGKEKENDTENSSTSLQI